MDDEKLNVLMQHIESALLEAHRLGVMEGLERAAKACEEERRAGAEPPRFTPEDLSYNMAISHCLAAIGSLKP